MTVRISTEKCAPAASPRDSLLSDGDSATKKGARRTPRVNPNRSGDSEGRLVWGRFIGGTEELAALRAAINARSAASVVG